MGGKGDSNPQGDHDLNSYSYEEIDQGLRDFAKKTMALPEFKDIVEDFSEELKEAGYGMEGGMGRGRGAAIDADILFYMKLAESYCHPSEKSSDGEKGISPSSFPFPLGGGVALSGYGHLDQFREDHARDHPDLEETRREGEGKDGGDARLLDCHRFFGEHDQSSEKPLLCSPRWLPAPPMPTYETTRK